MQELSFPSDTEALDYYRSLAKSLQSDLDDTKLALDEFQASSKELETELERELQATEKQLKELRGKEESLLHEIDQWKTKYHSSLKDHTKTMTHMQSELDCCRKSNEEYRTRLRDMELDNDELEGKERMVTSSLQDVEAKYGKAIERITLLEDELIEKSKLEEEHQRLKDDLRDMTEELAVLREHLSNSSVSSTIQRQVADLQLSTSPADSPEPRPSLESVMSDTGLEVLKDLSEMASPTRPLIRTKPAPLASPKQDSPRRRLASMHVDSGSPKNLIMKPLTSAQLKKSASLRVKLPTSVGKSTIQSVFSSDPRPAVSANNNAAKLRRSNSRTKPAPLENLTQPMPLSKSSSHLQSLRAETERMQGMTKKLVSSRNSRTISSIPVPKTSLLSSSMLSKSTQPSSSTLSKSTAHLNSALNRSVTTRSPRKVPNGINSSASRNITQPPTSQDLDHSFVSTGLPRPRSTRPSSRLSNPSDHQPSGIPMMINNRSETPSISGLSRRKESLDIPEKFGRPLSIQELAKSHSRRQSAKMNGSLSSEPNDEKTHSFIHGLNKSLSASGRPGTVTFRR